MPVPLHSIEMLKNHFFGGELPPPKGCPTVLRLLNDGSHQPPFRKLDNDELLAACVQKVAELVLRDQPERREENSFAPPG